MIYYDRIDISEGIDLAKSNNGKEYDLSLLAFYSWIQISRLCMQWLS